MGYTPIASSGAQLHVLLGYVNTDAGISGTAFTVNTSDGFSLLPTDVGNILVILRPVASGGPLWTTLAGYSGSTSGTTADSSTTVTGVKAVIFRENTYLIGSINYQGSLRNRPTFKFAIHNTSVGLTPADYVGIPILVRHSVLGDIFGGSIEQAKAINYPGYSDRNRIEFECIGWEQVLQKRLLSLVSTANPTRTDQFVGDSHTTSFSLTSIPTAAPTVTYYTWYGIQAMQWVNGVVYLQFSGSIPTVGATVIVSESSVIPGTGPGFNGTFVITGQPYSNQVTYSLPTYPGVLSGVGGVAFDPVAQTVAQTGAAPGTAQWYWDPNSTTLRQDTTLRGPLSDTEAIFVLYPYAAQLDFYNQTADQIVVTLAELIANEGLTTSTVVGPLVPHIAFTHSDTIASALQSVCDFISDGTNNYWVYISPRLVLTFAVQGVTTTAPWNISTSDASDGNVLTDVSNLVTREKYANVALTDLSKSLGTQQISDPIPLNGTRTVQATYPIGQLLSLTYVVPAISANAPIFGGPIFIPGSSTPQTFGILGDPTTGHGNEWYWSYGSATLTLDPSITAYVAGPARLVAVYLPLTNSLGSFINQSAISSRYAIELGSGEYDLYESLGSGSPELNGTSVAQQLASYYSALSNTVEIQTYRGGLQSGQGITISLPDIGAVGSYVVDSVEITDPDNELLWHVTMIAGAVIGDWKTAFRVLAGEPAPIGVSVGAASAPVPIAQPMAPVQWSPAWVAPVAGDALYKGDSFGVNLGYIQQQDGSLQPALTISGYPPISQTSPTLEEPFITNVAAVSGGSLNSPFTYSVGVCGIDSNGLRSAAVFFTISLASGSSQKLQISVTWPTGTASGLLFISNQTTAAPPPIQAIPPGYHQELTLTGTTGSVIYTLSAVAGTSTGVPDQSFDHFVFKVSREFVSGPFAQEAAAVTTNTISFGASELAGGLSAGAFVGRGLSKLANAIANTADTPLQDFTITGDDGSGNFTVTPDPLAAGCAAGDLFTLRTGSGISGASVTTPITATATSFTDPLFVNGYNNGLTVHGNATNLALVIAGKGAWQPPVTVLDNSGTVVTVTPWSIIPDATSVIVLVEQTPQVVMPSVKIPLSSYTNWQGPCGVIPVPNYAGAVVRIEAYTASVDGQIGSQSLVAFREQYIWGTGGTMLITQ